MEIGNTNDSGIARGIGARIKPLSETLSKVASETYSNYDKAYGRKNGSPE